MITLLVGAAVLLASAALKLQQNQGPKPNEPCRACVVVGVEGEAARIIDATHAKYVNVQEPRHRSRPGGYMN